MKKIYLTFFILITLLPALSYAQVQRDTLPLTTQQIIRALVKSLDSTYTKPQVDSITNLLIQSVNTKTDTSATEDIAEDVFNNNIAGYASEEYAANRAWSSADSVMNKTADSLLLKLYADFTQYDEEAPDETVFLVFQEPNSGVIYRATLGAIKALLQEITGDTINYTAAEVNAILEALSGGAISQVLTKISNADYDFGWADATGGSGIPQDSLDKKLYAEFNTQYPQATVPSVDNYIPVLTGTGNHYAALDDLPISSAVQTALNELEVGGVADIEYIRARLQLDTVATLTAFTPVTDATVSTLYTSDIIGVNSDNPNYSVIKTWTDIGEYRVRYNLRDTPTWSDWQSTAGYYRMVDSAQVRHTSSSAEETETEQTFYAGNDSKMFSVTTEGEPEPEPPNPPTLLVAEGGTSPTQVPITWTDPLIADSIRIYRDTKNDTTDMVWIASVAFGVESYLNTGLTANTEYWYTAKSLRDGLLSPYVVPDSATTLEASGDTLGANLLVNGDFETAFSGGNNIWEGSFGAIGEQSTEQVYAGTYSGKCITNGGGTGFRPQNGYIDYEAGKRYWIEGYIYIVGGTDTYVSCYITGYPDQAIYLDTTRDEWVYFSHPVDVETLIENGRILFDHYGGTPDVTFYLDNVSVKERLE